MSTRFSAGQTDYIAQLNLMDDQFQATLSAGPLTNSLGSLGTNLNDRSSIYKWSATDSNADYLEVSMVRDSAGASWMTAGWKIQQKVDGTWMSALQFGGATNPSGFSILTGSTTTSPGTVSERFKVDSAGNTYINSLTYLGFGSANYIRVAGATAGSGVGIVALGSDTNIDVNINGKGTGNVVTNSTFSTTKNIYASYTDASGGINITNTSSTTARYPQVTVANYSGTFGGHPVVELNRSRGSSISPTSVAANDILGGLNTWGHNGTNMVSATRVEGVAEATFSTAVTAGLKFSVTLAGTQAQGLYIAGDKTATFAGTAVAPNVKLTNTASADVNTLDNYTEGTFVPSVLGTTTAGVATYQALDGKYTRIGNRVDFTLRVQYTSHSGAGNMRVGLGSLPVSATSFDTPVTIMADSLSFTNQLAAAVITGTNQVQLSTFTNSGALTPLAIDVGATVWLTGTYFV
jgi:hypothetical protein